MAVAGSLRFEKVCFAHPSAEAELFRDLQLSLPGGWTGVVGPNGSGKTTLLRLALGELAPTAGLVHAPQPGVLCAQSTEAPPPGLDALMESTQPDACSFRGILQVAPDLAQRWSTASHGERKRAQLAEALVRDPAVLAMDEPTNHLDSAARTLLLRALREYQGIGLLVSHDRQLLDELCERCVFLDPPVVELRRGGFTQGRETRGQEHARRAAKRQQARQEQRRLEGEARRRREEAGRADRRRSKRGLDSRDHDAKARIDAARVSGRDGEAGRRSTRMQARVERARQQVEGQRLPPQHEMGIAWSGARSSQDRLLVLESCTIPLGPQRCLELPDLEIGAADRVGVVGPNGSGKSTLLRHLLRHSRVPPEQIHRVPQELATDEAQALIQRVRALPGERLGELMMVVRRLGSDPRRLLATERPSPGEARKLLFALGRVQEPALIVMDEPTNHLDLPSIEALEQALTDAPCALLLVSHDQPFLDALTDRRWILDAKGGLRIDRSAEG